MALAQVTLDDKYTKASGRIFLNAMQALVRLPLMQHQADQAAGLDTAGFISGYRGSPLGGLDHALWRAAPHLDAQDIKFQPGLNEDLAATALWGTQQTAIFPGPKYDGVFGMWYGKGPGVDRCGDVFKHANAAGTSPHGGVLAVAGDDHGAKSSTFPHQSDQAMIAAMIPVLAPAGVQDILDFGLLGWAMSRFSGCWVCLKVVAEVAESTATVDVGPGRVVICLPAGLEEPQGGRGIRLVDPIHGQEERLIRYKLPSVQAFARANNLDRVVIDGGGARLGIAAAGKAYMDVRQALEMLGIGERKAARMGLRLYKIGMVWPLEPGGARDFARGLEEILVVEEKRPVIEEQFNRLLFNLPSWVRPRIVGKQDEEGLALLPAHGETTPAAIAVVLGERLNRLVDDAALKVRLDRICRRAASGARRKPDAIERTPYFCSGCPHNISTKVPAGSRAQAGIGCHTLAAFMPNRSTFTYTHMGGEGANWIGQAPFTQTEHIFQNLGDGTYNHSGLLAIRAAVAAGVNITYKILYNDAVAMTGGQPLEGHPGVDDISWQVHAEGVERVAVVSDDPGKFSGLRLPPGLKVYHRDRLDEVQRRLREEKGVTVLIYEQTCAAEKRRRRKRNLFPDPPKRIFINDLVCEGCGDCGEVSNCVSIKPLETIHGRKRRIDQSSCNKDYSCADGFCPSFVSVLHGEPRRPSAAIKQHPGRPNPPPPAALKTKGPYNIVITGIGGTGVVTVGALLGMAAHLEGKAVSILDQTGLAQKNGAVLSHVRIAATPAELHANRVVPGETDLLLGCDMVVAAGGGALGLLGNNRTRAVVNGHVEATSAFVFTPDMLLDAGPLRLAIENAVVVGGADFVAASDLAMALLGDAVATNPFMVGYAYQKGLLPVGEEALLKAMELNGIAVEMNVEAFGWGRAAAADLEAVLRIAAPNLPAPPEDLEERDLGDLVEHRIRDLVAYQDLEYAKRYQALVNKAVTAEHVSAGGRGGLAFAVARNFYKLLAYKDEYEVARLYTDGRFEQRLKNQFEGEFKLRFHMAPPLLARRDPRSGHPRKMEFGPWMFFLLGRLRKLKFLRGTVFDPFGYTAERRAERQLIEDYEVRMIALLRRLNPANYDTAQEIATLPSMIRGFGHIKQSSIEKAERKVKTLMERFERTPDRAAAE